MKFTKEEISLCKQVAERHRKKLIWGDWWKGKGEDIFLMNIPGETLHISDQHNDIIPLWTISDCLEFLKEPEYTFERSYQLGGIFTVCFISGEGTKRGSGDTFLVACLKVVLAVLEEKE